MKITLTLLLAGGLWLPLSGQAQTPDSLVTYNDFRIIPFMPNLNMQLAGGYQANAALFSFAGNYDWSHLYLEDEKVIVMGQTGKKEAKLMRLDKMGKADWELPLAGVCYKLGKLGENALLIHGEKLGLGNFKDWELLASLVDPATGKIIKTASVFHQSEDYISEPKLFMDPAGKWFYVGGRKTRITPRIHFDSKKNDALYNNTLSFSIKPFNENLEAGTAEDIPLSPDGDAFLGCEMSGNGNLFMAFLSDEGRLFAEKRNRADAFKKPDVLDLNLSLMKKTAITPFFYIPSSGAEKAFLHFQYIDDDKKPVADFYAFDFERKKAFRSTEITDKDFRVTLQDSYQEVNGVDFGKLQNVEGSANVSQIIETGNRTVVLREDIRLKVITTRDESRLSGGTSRQKYFLSSPLIIEVFNENNKLLKRWLIPKNYIPESLAGLQSAGYIINGQLIVLNNATKKNKPFGVVSVFDLKTLKPVSRSVITKENSKRWMAMEPGAVCWFSDSYLLPYAESKTGYAGINARFDTILEAKNVKGILNGAPVTLP